MACEKGFLGKSQCWYKLKWEQDTENDKVQLCGNFDYRMRKQATADDYWV